MKSLLKKFTFFHFFISVTILPKAEDSYLFIFDRVIAPCVNTYNGIVFIFKLLLPYPVLIIYKEQTKIANKIDVRFFTAQCLILLCKSPLLINNKIVMHVFRLKIIN